MGHLIPCLQLKLRYLVNPLVVGIVEVEVEEEILPNPTIQSTPPTQPQKPLLEALIVALAATVIEVLVQNDQAQRVARRRTIWL